MFLFAVANYIFQYWGIYTSPIMESIDLVAIAICPFLGSLITMYFVKPYRIFILSKMKRRWKIAYTIFPLMAIRQGNNGPIISIMKLWRHLIVRRYPWHRWILSRPTSYSPPPMNTQNVTINAAKIDRLLFARSVHHMLYHVAWYMEAIPIPCEAYSVQPMLTVSDR